MTLTLQHGRGLEQVTPFGAQPEISDATLAQQGQYPARVRRIIEPRVLIPREGRTHTLYARELINGLLKAQKYFT